MGTVEDICYQSGALPLFDQPAAVMVRFDKYSGPTLENTGLAPVTAVAKSFTDRNVACTRTQFPLMLAWAVTTHKAQGLPLEKAVIDIGAKEMVPGLTYVALARVKTLEGLVFKPHFTSERLQKVGIV